MLNSFQKKILIICALLVFSAVFFKIVASDSPLIFKKDLLAHDESSNSVVAANITRKAFPPMIRTNPLVEEQGNWMEGPFWQHIPPLFAYVPYIPFMLDGQVSIEVKRLSFAALLWITALLFIYLTYRLSRSVWVGMIALIASIIWIQTPFTRELVTGFAFGVSDIVLAFATVLAFCALVWYIKDEQQIRKEYPWWKICIVALAVTVPLLAKNLLGAIPGAIFLFFIVKDFRFTRRFWQGITAAIALALAYYLPLYLSSPETFTKEILISFFHNSDYEGWGRPWHYYFSNYLPNRYLFNWTPAFWLGLLFSAWYLAFGRINRTERVLLALPMVWFVWNLLAVTVVESKIANFIFQSYLLVLFAIIFPLVFTLKNICMVQIFERIKSIIAPHYQKIVVIILVVALTFTGVSFHDLANTAHAMRGNTYVYATEREKFYQTGEELQDLGLTNKDITVVRVSDNDCWLRYNILFLTGAESKTLLEMHFGYDPIAIKTKYSKMHFIVNKNANLEFTGGVRQELANFSRFEFDLSLMTHEQIDAVIKQLINAYSEQIVIDIARIKKDLTSCQWLVPDPILNAP